MSNTPLRTLLVALWLACPAAHAAEWSTVAPGGQVIAIVEDSTRTRDGYLLERRYPDGRPDTQFGDGGSITFSLGPDNDGPAVLRLDAQGRAWVAGGSQGADGMRAVVLRFSANGRPDRSFAAGGRSSTAPAGREARATDLLPQDDGSAWVTGTVVDAQGDERSGVWRLRNDGSVDPRFGLGGLWQDNGRGATDSAGLLRSPDGELALGVRRSEGPHASLEIWSWREGAAPRRTHVQAVDPRRIDRVRLAWRDGRWQWGDEPATQAATQPAAPAVPAPPATPATEAPAAAIASPFVDRPPPAATAAPQPAPLDTAAGWWLLLPAGGLAGVLWWWRRRPPHD